MATSLTERLLKTSKIKATAIMPESKIFEGLLSTPTRIPMVNVALSGDVEGGLEGGLGVIAGPSIVPPQSEGLSVALDRAFNIIPWWEL